MDPHWRTRPGNSMARRPLDMQQATIPSRGLSLNEVLPNAHFFNGGDVQFSSCCSDAYQCQDGDLFVALLGDEDDGHELAREAIRRGAKGVVAERPLPLEVPVCVVPDTRQALGHVCQALAGNPSQRMDILGVTGTNGKTVTSLLMQSVLHEAGRCVGASTTMGYDDSFETRAASQTTPAPTELADLMARMVAAGCTNAVVEVNSQALARHQLAGVELDAAIVTNVRRNHLDLHGSVMNYRRIKSRILNHLSPEAFLVLNADDAGSKMLESKSQNPTITVALHGDAEIRATVVERFPSEQTFLIHAGNDSIPVRTQIIGDQHIYSCLQVVAAGLIMGISLPTIVRGLEAITTLPGRMERLECGQPFSVFVDLANTPDRLAMSLKNLKRVAQGRVICVYGPDAYGDHEHRPLLGRVAEKTADVSIITSNQPGLEEPLQIVHDVLDGYDRVARAHVMPDREHAITHALEQARPGDAVLIAGKGNVGYQVHGQTHGILDDRQIAERWLYRVGSQLTYADTSRPRILPFSAQLN
ncbi:MAG TPA: hypothetical protein DCY79_01170 [Planctomycetaceae bacterium]|nr:hypothetical protein [Planctomycetaceae bacterium]